MALDASFPSISRNVLIERRQVALRNSAEFSRPTQARWLRKLMPESLVNTFFEPLEPDKNACRNFRFRIQDPVCPGNVEAIVRELDPQPENFRSSAIRVVAVEVFLDATPETQVGPWRLEGLRLRVIDVDFDRRAIIMREAEGRSLRSDSMKDKQL